MFHPFKLVKIDLKNYTAQTSEESLVLFLNYSFIFIFVKNAIISKGYFDYLLNKTSDAKLSRFEDF